MLGASCKDSNLRPPTYRDGALPSELTRQIDRLSGLPSVCLRFESQASALAGQTDNHRLRGLPLWGAQPKPTLVCQSCFGLSGCGGPDRTGDTVVMSHALYH